ncbi:MAG: preprotein translocase subunit SecG [Parasporobacterium sp.]|nr:preprotein translocase subunit SecG [Parasporobacterium sp.]
MSVFYIIATIVISIIAVILIVAITLQQSKSAGLSGALAGQSESYWSKNKSRSKEGKLERITTIAGIVFFILAILLNVGMFIK